MKYDRSPFHELMAVLQQSLNIIHEPLIWTDIDYFTSSGYNDLIQFCKQFLNNVATQFFILSYNYARNVFFCTDPVAV